MMEGGELFYVYILLCLDGSFYTGYTKDVDKRVRMHACGKGARYTRMHRIDRIAYVETLATRSEAMKREKILKRLTHKQKSDLMSLNKAEASSNEESQN